MLPIGMFSALLGIVASVLAADPRASDVWATVMIGCMAVALGSAVSVWSSPEASDWSPLRSVKTFFGTIGGVAAAPGVLIALGMFVFCLIPTLVILLPVLAGWDFAALHHGSAIEKSATPRMARLAPRHA